MTTRNPPIVDAALLGRLSGLSFRPGQRVEGSLTGRHKSPFHGASVEFAQHRDYVPGDELRHVDWKTFARTDRYYVKEFEDETNLRVFMVVDTSGSMGFGFDDGETKLNYAARLAAVLSWLFIKQGDAVGLLPVGEVVERYIPPSAQPAHFWRLVSLLENLRPDGKTDLSRALRFIADLPSRRSLVFVISDCFDFHGKFVALARQLQRRSHHLSVIQVLDRAELEFPFSDLTQFEELESDAMIQVDPKSMRDEYIRQFGAWRTELRRTLIDGRVDHMELATDQELESAVRLILPRLDR